VISSLREIHCRRKDPMQPVASQFTQQIEALKVLIVDDEATVRKVTRSLLQVIQAMAPRNTYP
jgi:PleD family two-component response regulator